MAARGTLTERFWRHVDKNGPIIRPELGPCWLWTGATDDHGYGKIAPPAETRPAPLRKASRVSFEIHFRPLAPNEEACHKCDNPPCVRPEHLFAGTHLQNIADSVAKGRWRPKFLKTHCKRGHPKTATSCVECKATYRHRNKDKCKSYEAAYRNANREHLRLYAREYARSRAVARKGVVT